MASPFIGIDVGGAVLLAMGADQTTVSPEVVDKLASGLGNVGK